MSWLDAGIRIQYRSLVTCATHGVMSCTSAVLVSIQLMSPSSCPGRTAGMVAICMRSNPNIQQLCIS